MRRIKMFLLALLLLSFIPAVVPVMAAPNPGNAWVEVQQGGNSYHYRHCHRRHRRHCRRY
jgi:hypothetical protein